LLQCCPSKNIQNNILHTTKTSFLFTAVYHIKHLIYR